MLDYYTDVGVSIKNVNVVFSEFVDYDKVLYVFHFELSVEFC